MTEQEEKHATVQTIYFRGKQELAELEKMKKAASNYGFSWSNFAKLILANPVKALQFAWEWYWGPYDGTDTLRLISGEETERDMIRKDLEEFSVEQLITCVKAQHKARRLVELYNEVCEEVLKEKMKLLGESLNENKI